MLSKLSISMLRRLVVTGFIVGLMLTPVITRAISPGSEPNPFTPILDFVEKHYAEITKDTGNPWHSFIFIIKPNTQYVENVAVLNINGVSGDTLEEFTNDVRNDVFWFPGVTNVVRTQGNGRTGTVYQETLNFGGVTFTDDVVVAGFVGNKWMIQNSINGPVNSSGILFWNNTLKGGRFALYGLVPIPQGTSLPDFKAQLSQANFAAMNNLMAHFNTTGTITYSDSVITTPNF